MFRLPEFRRLFRFGSRRPEAIPGDVDAEVEFHLKMRIQELMARGLAEPEARAEADRRFGDVPGARAELIAADTEPLEPEVSIEQARLPFRDDRDSRYAALHGDDRQVSAVLAFASAAALAERA